MLYKSSVIRSTGKICIILSVIFGILVVHEVLIKYFVHGQSGSLVKSVKQSSRKDKETVFGDLNYQWLMKGTNILPNYFTSRSYNSNIKTRQPPDHEYSNGTIVFVHNQKSGGSTIKNCLGKLIRANYNQSPSLIGQKNAIPYYTNMNMGNIEVTKKAYVGDSTFGICDYSTRPCSYFTILRDPYERVISSYNLCIVTNSKTEQCQIKNAADLSVKEWALHQGSWFFRQLLLNPDFLTEMFDERIERMRAPDDPSTTEMPPWWRGELMLRYVMPKEKKAIVLEYVLDNLESWFAVIGLTTEFDTNFRLLERVYKLPFASQCEGMTSNARPYTSQGESTNVTKDEIKDRLRDELVSDDDVNEVLYYDVKIFRKAQDIFRRQVLAYKEGSAMKQPDVNVRKK
ncbi:uncharacterized protein LOC144452334 [Glandiceps talaboti]